MELVTHGLSGIVASSLGIQQKFGFTGTLALTAKFAKDGTLISEGLSFRGE